MLFYYNYNDPVTFNVRLLKGLATAKKEISLNDSGSSNSQSVLILPPSSTCNVKQMSFSF